LRDLLNGAATSLPVEAIEEALRSRESGTTAQSVTVTPSVDASVLAAAYARLMGVVSNGNAQRSRAIARYAGLLQNYLPEPDQNSQDQYSMRRLGIKNGKRAEFLSLSEIIRRGVYLLLVSGVDVQHIDALLKLESIEQTVGLANVLSLVSHLFHAGVRGFESGFDPSTFDQKFFSQGAQLGRLYSLYREYEAALFLSSLEDATGIRMAQTVRLNVGNVPREDAARLERAWKAAHPSGASLPSSIMTELDMVYTSRTSGKSRLVEIKSSVGEYGEESSAESLYQATRHAVMAKSYGMEGVVYFFNADSVSPAFLASLEKVFSEIKIPFAAVLTRSHPRVLDGTLPFSLEPAVSPQQSRTFPFPYSRVTSTESVRDEPVTEISKASLPALSESAENYLRFNFISITSRLEDWKDQFATELEVLDGMLAESHGMLGSSMNEITQLFEAETPDTLFLSHHALGMVTLREMIDYLDALPDDMRPFELINQCRMLIQAYDAWKERLAARVGEPKPLPDSWVAEYRARVLEDGPIATRRSPHGEVPLRERVRGSREFSPEKVESIFNHLIIARFEGDPTIAYYFEEDLKTVQATLRSYLRRCQWGEARIKEQVVLMTQEALARKGLTHGAAESVASWIPDNFKRADLVEMQDPFTGRRMDLPDLVSRLRRRHPEHDMTPGIRPVLVGVGHKVYFINSDWLVKNYPEDLFGIPGWNDLTKIVSDRRLFSLLASLRVFREQKIPAWSKVKKITLIGKRDISTGRMTGLRVAVDKEEISIPNSAYFSVTLAFDGSRFRVQSVSGGGGLELGLAMANNYRKLEGPLSPAEMMIVAKRWGTKIQDTRLSTLPWKDFLLFMERTETDPIDKLWQTSRLADVTLLKSPTELVLVGHKDAAGEDAQVRGLGLYLPGETYPGNKSYFRIRFRKSDLGWQVAGADGPYVIEILRSYFAARGILLPTNPVELYLLATKWGLNSHSLKGSGVQTPTFDDLTAYFRSRENGVEDLWSVLRRFDESLPAKPKGERVLLTDLNHYQRNGLPPLLSGFRLGLAAQTKIPSKGIAKVFLLGSGSRLRIERYSGTGAQDIVDSLKKHSSGSGGSRGGRGYSRTAGPVAPAIDLSAVSVAATDVESAEVHAHASIAKGRAPLTVFAGKKVARATARTMLLQT